MCLRISQDSEEMRALINKNQVTRVQLSAYYSKHLKELILLMFNVNSATKTTAAQFLDSEFIKHFLLEESLRGKAGQYALDQAMGTPFDQYERYYKEKRLLGQGGMGRVMLVKRREDHEFFAAKLQLDIKHFESAKAELLLL